MPRKPAGARLYFRKDQAVYIIRDTSLPDRSTGTGNRADAEKALSLYIARKGVVADTRTPEYFSISEALDIYGREKAVGVVDPARIGYAIIALVKFWDGMNVSDIKGETCRRYAASRIRVFKDGHKSEISDGTIRRELNVLQAAVNYCHKEGYLTATTSVTLPDAPPARDRWLTRDEAARLVWAAYRSPKGKHVARFILIAIYSGTRKAAILGLGFSRHKTGGWIDVDQGLIYRRGSTERETKKRRKPVRMMRRLRAHCRRWRDTGAKWAIEIDGQRVGDIKRAFEGAASRAKMPEVTPHTLKHTAITWAMQKGMRTKDAADYYDTSEETINRVYYHHSPHYQDEAVDVLDGKL